MSEHANKSEGGALPRAPKLQRIHTVAPGYDCKYAPCKHKKTGDHGIHGDEWIYVVTDGDAAVNLTIFTGRFPTTVPPMPRLFRDDPCGNMAADLGLHTLFPRYDDHHRQDHCKWLNDRPCYYDGSGSRAGDFWKKHGNGAQPEQGEFFWLALEQEFREWVEPLRAERARLDCEWAL